MRRLLTFAVLALALVLPAGVAARTTTSADGTLSVKDARGVVTIQGRGAVIGSFAKGSVTINDPIAYTKAWTPHDKLPLKLMPPGTDMMEMICSPTEAAAYKKLVDTQKK